MPFPWFLKAEILQNAGSRSGVMPNGKLELNSQKSLLTLSSSLSKDYGHTFGFYFMKSKTFASSSTLVPWEITRMQMLYVWFWASKIIL